MRLLKVEKLASSSKLRRLLYHPFRFLVGILHREIFYRIFKKGLVVRVLTFWNQKMFIKLPASIDIFITGGKTDDSELRLSKFIVKNLSLADHFLDSGAHFGYYSLLASYLTGKDGKILSVEPSKEINKILLKNVSGIKNIIPVKAVLLEKEGESAFFEFPIKYSEYNATDTAQYNKSKWYKSSRQKKVILKSITGDLLIKQHGMTPKIIKIDVEGSENRVVKGLQDYLSNNKCFVVMEFVNSKRDNRNHIEAEKMLRELSYFAFKIDSNGNLIALSSPAANYVDSIGISSDNIVYSKTNMSRRY